MASYYYYLVAQLPGLIFGQPTMPMSPKAFKELAKPQLGARDAALFDMVSLDPQPLPALAAALGYTEKIRASGSAFIDGWREWEWALRLNLAKQRAIKTKRDYAVAVEPPVTPSEVAALAQRAIAVESPLEGELFLDRARWDAIEALQGNDFFDRNTVFAYMLKLLILQRHALFQIETGFSEYKSLYASILESAESGTSRAGESK